MIAYLWKMMWFITKPLAVVELNKNASRGGGAQPGRAPLNELGAVS